MKSMDVLRRLLAALALPYLRLELPGWRRVASFVGLPMGNERIWANSPPRTIRGKYHGYKMPLRMQDWCERLTYVLGRYYELPLELLLRTLLLRGETFIDVGGNIGMVTLMGAAGVGEKGRIYTFEPNPQMVERIREVVALNELSNVTIFPFGLSDTNSDLPLTIVSESSGWATFGKAEMRDPSLTYRTITTKVARADDVLSRGWHLDDRADRK